MTLSEIYAESVDDINTFRRLHRIGFRFGRETRYVTLSTDMTPEQVAEALLKLATELEAVK